MKTFRLKTRTTSTFGHTRFRCPSCWRFIHEDDPVRRSAADLLTHADCPEPVGNRANR